MSYFNKLIQAITVRRMLGGSFLFLHISKTLEESLECMIKLVSETIKETPTVNTQVAETAHLMDEEELYEDFQDEFVSETHDDNIDGNEILETASTVDSDCFISLLSDDFSTRDQLEETLNADFLVSLRKN